MTFFILQNHTKQGPYTLEELRSKDINGQTMVWSTGFTNWEQAKDVPELTELLSDLPPEVPSPTPMPKTWLVESIIVTCCCCLPFGIVGIINSVKIETEYQNKQYEQALYHSRQARKWTLWGFFTTLTFIALYIICLMIAIAYGSSIY